MRDDGPGLCVQPQLTGESHPGGGGGTGEASPRQALGLSVQWGELSRGHCAKRQKEQSGSGKTLQSTWG